MIALSENTKLIFDLPSDQGQPTPSGQAQNSPVSADDTGQVAAAESQMRKALGLLGENPRLRPDGDRQEQSARGSDRFNGGLHRRRFVQDGDVPVTVLRREPGHEAPAHRSAAAVAAPSSSRLQRTEAALAAETAARERAERALAEAQAAVRDLQTKIGHAELAKNEAIQTVDREREVISGLRAEIEALQARAQDLETRVGEAEDALTEHQAILADERQARRALEKTLHAAETARDAAQQLVRTLSADAPEMPRLEPLRRRRAVVEPAAPATVARRGRPPAVTEPENEPEPVKWWLNPKPAPKRR